MRAAIYYGQRDIRVEDVPDPMCAARDIVIKTGACGVCGTDLSTYEHGSLFAAEGDVMGHEFSGRIVEAGEDVVGLAVGDRVTSWPIVHCDRCPRCAEGNWHLCENAWGASISSGLPGGFAEYIRIPNARVNRTVYRLPESVSWSAGAMVEPLGVALSAVRFADVECTDTVIVTGLGMIGIGVVQMLKLFGVRHIIGVDTVRSRRERALSLGAERVFGAPGENVGDLVRELTGTGPLNSAHVDAVIECTGAAPAVDLAIELVRPAGRLVLVGLSAASSLFDLNALIVKQVRMQGTFAYRTEYADVLDLIGSGRLAVDELVTQTFGLSDVTKAFEAQGEREHALKVMVAGAGVV